ncbi:MAG: TolC family protein, partial [Deltaproteobacteria bacterium]|nr:TolC family protein [Deltaproteobacteria bacterium]
MRSRTLFFTWKLFILLFFILFQNASADEGKNKVYTLDESIKEALSNNWSIKAKKEKIEETIYGKKKAKADFFPKFSTTYSYNRLDEQRIFRSTAPGGQNIAVSSLDNYRWKGTITQPLFTGFALISAYELAKLGIDLSEMELELEKLDLALRVKDAYFNILKADIAVQVAEKAVEALASHVKVARSFYKVGMIPINDVLKSEVELANAQYDLVRAQNASKLTRAAFNTTLSRPVNEPVEVEDIISYTPEEGDFESYLGRALQKRPEIKVIDINTLQTGQQVRLAKSKYYPEVALNYDYIKEGDHLDVSGSDFHDGNSWQVTAVLSWTFWEWGKTRNTVREAESVKNQLMKTRMAMIDGINFEIKQAVLDLEKEEKNIPTTKKAVEAAEENLRVSQERYKAQVTTSTEVL